MYIHALLLSVALAAELEQPVDCKTIRTRVFELSVPRSSETELRGLNSPDSDAWDIVVDDVSLHFEYALQTVEQSKTEQARPGHLTLLDPDVQGMALDVSWKSELDRVNSQAMRCSLAFANSGMHLKVVGDVEGTKKRSVTLQDEHGVRFRAFDGDVVSRAWGRLDIRDQGDIVIHETTPSHGTWREVTTPLIKLDEASSKEIQRPTPSCVWLRQQR